MQTRRQFTSSLALLFVALAAPFAMLGCGIFSDILAWVPVGISAINGIVTVLGALLPPSAVSIIALIKTAFTDLTATINAYNADTNPADKATLLAKIRTLLAEIAANFQSFLDQLNLGNNPIEAIVIGLANVFLAAIQGFLGQLPAPAGGATKTLTATFRVDRKTMPLAPKYYKHPADFKHDWNLVCIADGHPEIEIQ